MLYGLRLMFLLAVVGFVVQMAAYGLMALVVGGALFFPVMDKRVFTIPGGILAFLLVIPLFGYLASKVDLGFDDEDKGEKKPETKGDGRPSWE